MVDTPSSTLATLEQIKVRRRGINILNDVSCSLPIEGTTVIMGPNGSGKTTLLRVMFGLQNPNSGQVDWADEAASATKSFVFQTPIIMRRSVLDNLAYPLTVSGMKKSQAREVAAQFVANHGLKDRMEVNANRLSGGEKQKLAIARALITKPRILFLDEPTANLDGHSTREIENVLKEVAAGGTKVFLASHDMGQAKRLADDILLLHMGKLIESTKAPTFFKRPKTPTGRSYLKGDILT